jgi:methyl-accepting chemotaxis protein
MASFGFFIGRVAAAWQRLTDIRRGRLAPRLVALCLIAAVVPLVAAVLIGGQAVQRVLQDQAETSLQSYAAAVSAQIESALADHLKDAKVLAADPAVVRLLATAPEQRTDAMRDAAQASIQRFLGSDASYTIGFLLSDKGIVQFSTDPALYSRPDLSFRPYFKDGIAGRANVSDVSMGVNVQSSPAMFFTAPVKDAAGSIVGTATLRINAEAIWAALDTAKVSPGSTVALVDEDGVVIGPGKPELLWHSLGQLPKEAQDTVKARFNLEKIDSLNLGDVAATLKGAQARLASENPKVLGHLQFAFTSGRSSQSMVGGYAYLASRKWAVLIMQPQAEFLLPVQRAASTALPGVALVGAVMVVWAAFAVLYSIRRQFQYPVKEMLGVMELVAAGELESRVPDTSDDEIGRLGSRLNEMLDSLTELVQTREERDALQERIQHLLAEVSTVAEGDLTIQAEVTADVTGALADAFNFMTDELRKIVSSIDVTTGQVTDSAGQVLVASQDLAHMSQAQATRVQEVSQAVEQMARAINEVSENATRSAQVAGEALANAGRGGQAVTQVVDAMGRIRGNTHQTAQKIKRLGETSQRVGEIVQLIEDLADQTNLLALNAAIQAASAGEHGRGFAVVADEVRRLAERSAEATKQIDGLIHAIQSDTAAAVVAMEESTQQVVAGSRLVDEAGQSLGSIQDVVEDLARLITAISQTAQEHARTAAMVASSMTEVSSVTQQTTENTQQTAERVSYLAHLADQLRSSVSAFRLPSSASV